MTINGYMGKLLFVDLANQDVRVEELWTRR